MERRKKDIESLEKMRVEDEKERHRNQPVPTFEDSASQDTESDRGAITESNFSDSQTSCDEFQFTNVARKKRRLSSTATITQEGDILPQQYQHIRHSIRKVKPEFYETVDKLKSCHHMSEAQAVAAVVTVGNHMFGRNWKSHDNTDVIDLDTCPESKL